MIDIATATLIATGAIALATFALVGSTLYYAIQAKKLVQETQKTREYEYSPIIKASFSFIGPVDVALRTENIGKGPAINIQAVINFAPQRTLPDRDWKERVLTADSYREFLLREYSPFEKLGNYIADITITGTFDDVSGKTQHFTEKVNALEFYRNRKAADILLQVPIETTLNQIAKSLEDIAEIKK